MKPYFRNELTTIYNGDCLEVMDYLIEQGIKVDTIITDPPYGNMKNAPSTWDATKLEWDTTIKPKDIYIRAERLLKKNARLILFSQEPYTSQLIVNNIGGLPFTYRMIWEKDTFANALGSNDSPVNMFEDIVVFKKIYDHSGQMKEYHYKIYKALNMTKKEIAEKIKKVQVGNMFLEESGGGKTLQKISETDYNLFMSLIKKQSFFSYEEYNKMWEEFSKTTFNLRKDQKYKSNILKYRKDYMGLHPTQKPVELIIDLVKTYTNKGDLVLDFTSGSFSTSVACEQVYRRSIGIEISKEYCDIGIKRLNNLQLKLDI